MKKIAIAILLAASLSYAGEYFTFNQSCGGAAGEVVGRMTCAAPSAATDGVPIQSPAFSANPHPVANQVKLSVRASGSQTFVDDGNDLQMTLDCYRYALDPFDSGTQIWSRFPSCDGNLSNIVDAGTGTSVALNVITLPVINLPAEPAGAGNRYAWRPKNILQTTGADAGIGLLIEMSTP